MAASSADPFTVSASYNSLIHRIADREAAALAELYGLLARPTFWRVHVRIDDVRAAVAVTDAAFVEVWRLAPARRRFDDARGWLCTIADRRTADRLRARAWPAMLDTAYDEHMAFELAALIRHSTAAPSKA